MRPIFCGNFEYDARQSELERLFRRYGRVEKVDMKSGFAFVYMEDERDGEDAIRGLDQIEFGRKGRRIRVEWTKQERGIRRPGGGSKRSANTRPSKTLFVINFDPYRTRTRDLERHFDPYGKVANVRIRKNFAFIQFETQDDATRALEATHSSKLMDRLISVEYAIRDDDERGNGYSPDKIRDRSPTRRGYDRGRSPSPYRRERGSPDYGHGPSHSPNVRRRASPEYGSRSSPSPYQRERANSDYGRGPSPNPRGRERANSRDGYDLSPSPRRMDGRNPRRSDDHGPSRSPHRGNARARSLSPPHRIDGHDLSSIPCRSEGSVHSPSSCRKDSGRHSHSSPRQDDIDPNRVPRRGDRISPDYARDASPNSKDELKSPNYVDESPLPERDCSGSPS